jgi:hypothetical protein
MHPAFGRTAALATSFDHAVAAGIEAALFASAEANGEQNLTIAGTCSDKSPRPSTPAGTSGSTEVSGRGRLSVELWKALVVWEAGGDRGLLRRSLLALLTSLEDDPTD